MHVTCLYFIVSFCFNVLNLIVNIFLKGILTPILKRKNFIFIMNSTVITGVFRKLLSILVHILIFIMITYYFDRSYYSSLLDDDSLSLKSLMSS